MNIGNIRDSTHVKYKTTFNVIARYNIRQPISIIHFHDTWACRIGDKDQYLEITINGSKKSAMGLHYWNVDIDITSDTHAGPENERDIEHHCLLLPQLTKSGLPKPGSEM